jgi:Putative zinc-finger
VNDQAGPCVSAQAPWLREAIGGYVLDALDPAESDVVAAHLAECAGCQEEYEQLRELLPLLGAVTESEALLGPVRPEPPDVRGLRECPEHPEHSRPAARGRPPTTRGGSGSGGSGGNEGESTSGGHSGKSGGSSHPPDRQDTRRPRPTSPGRFTRSRRTRALAVTFALALLLTTSCAIAMRMVTDSSGAAVGWSASADPKAADADPDADDVSASVQVTAAPWGSNIRMLIADVPKGYKCTMIVASATGRREATAAWQAPSAGTFTVPAASSIAPDQIALIQVRLPDGTTLVAFRHP